MLDHYDIVADVGDQTGTMKAFDITSPANGQITIQFDHEVENPLVNRWRGRESLCSARRGATDYPASGPAQLPGWSGPRASPETCEVSSGSPAGTRAERPPSTAERRG